MLVHDRVERPLGHLHSQLDSGPALHQTCTIVKLYIFGFVWNLCGEVFNNIFVFPSVFEYRLVRVSGRDRKEGEPATTYEKGGE